MAQKRYGQASERLAKLLIDTKHPEPYEVTDTVVIAPLTKKRSQGLLDAQMALGMSTSLLQQAMSRAAAPRPPYPTTPEPPAALGKNPKPDDITVYETAVEKYEKAVEVWRGLVTEWERLQRDWEGELERHSKSMDDIGEKMSEQSSAYTRELFGAAYDDVIGYFEEQPVELWNAFVNDLKEEFGLTSKPAQVPDDGVCPECGAVEQEQAGKAPESSTSLKTIGTQSNEISVDEDLTLEIGSAV